uniref:Bak-1 n=1 Tax=Schmidtea mediterranea TaxID=79327 RepID=H2DL12_SCHMD|nr:bak-1 [Schmidtea mediterranea]
MAAGDVNNDDQMNKLCEETIEIFECFVETQLENDRERNRIDPGTPGLPPEDLPHTPDNRDNVSWQIGKKLAGIADTLVLDEESRGLISEIVQLVNVGPDDTRAFDEFSEIAKKVIANEITWENVATLFYFGYCIARDRLTQGVQHFLSQLLKWIVDIFKRLGIFQWILNNGGWIHFLGYNNNGDDTFSVWVYRSAVVVVLAFVCISVYRNYSR